MSSIFSGVQNSLGSTLTQGAVAAGEAKAKLKDKKEETKAFKLKLKGAIPEL